MAIIAEKAWSDCARFVQANWSVKALTMTMQLGERKRRREMWRETFLIPYAVKEPASSSEARFSHVYSFLIASI